MAGIFKNPLPELKEYEEFARALQTESGPVQLTGCMDSEKVHLMSSFLEQYRWQLVVTYNENRAREIYEDYRLFTSEVFLFPAKDMIFFHADLAGNQITAERMRVLKQLLEGKGGVIVTTIDALMNALPPLSVISDSVLHWKAGDVLEPEAVSRCLVSMGYEAMGRVELPGQFSVHGGIIDVFPLTEETPVRVELWGDEIDTIRCFDAQSQRSIEVVSEAAVYPATELVVTEKQKHTAAVKLRQELKKQMEFFQKKKEGDKAKRLREETEEILEALNEERMLTAPESYVRYFYPACVTFDQYFSLPDTVLFLDEPMRLTERGTGVQTEFEESMKNRLEQGYVLAGQTDLLTPVRTLFARLEHEHTAALTSLDTRISDWNIRQSYSLNVRNMNTYKNSFEMLIQDLTGWKREKYRVVLLCASHTRGKRIAGELQEYGLHSYYSEEEEKEVGPGEILVTYGNLHRGFLYPMLKFAVITEGDIYGLKKKKKSRKVSYQGKHIQDFTELKPGDFVVHENFGLGIFRGIEKETVDRVARDYIKIEYGDGGKLYIPATQLGAIQKYADAGTETPKLNNLGGPEWNKTKARVQKAVKDIAKELVQLYAARQNASGYAFSPDNEWQKEFEEMFPFEETEDQLTAIEDTKRDMESTRIMDRLICGDVGYGKTEIAIRAAFKAVQDGKQVVFLVPTTILAQQHYNTFVERMKAFPIRIDLLSRFRTPAQVQQTLDGLRKGLVDIVIGTHKVLSKRIVYKDLGLLMIDEEQRFGVTHKEKIKQLKQNVDVLTLTATPIPRTLHMSLIGVRDMSVLEEAPQDRRPIQTYVMEMNWEVVREAINRELARDGQVYYVYNRVKDIDQVASQIAQVVPDASVAYAHGQMPERQLEKIMMDFVNGEIDVLVSTTIIETGLDIPNVNTMIVHDADRYGLSQLYQLRGRVGRSNRTSFAFIMYQRGKLLREVAEKRLSAIREYTELGSGIKIAMRDLEIRGAGNLLGSEQHGHMEAVGYDLYCKMLNEAVRLMKGEIEEEESFDTTIEVPINAYIPNTYIRNEAAKLDMYKRISVVENEEEASELVDELIDRFGEVPAVVMNLLQVSILRSEAHKAYVQEIRASRSEAKFYLYPKAKLDVAKFPAFIRSYGGAMRLVDQAVPYLVAEPGKGKLPDRVISFETVKMIVNSIKELRL